MVSKGEADIAVPISYRDMAAAYPDLFAKPEDARYALRAARGENPGNSPISNLSIGVLPGFLSIGYRRTGSRGPASRLLYDPGRIDPEAWLRERVGAVTTLADAAPAEAEQPVAMATLPASWGTPIPKAGEGWPPPPPPPRGTPRRMFSAYTRRALLDNHQRAFGGRPPEDPLPYPGPMLIAVMNSPATHAPARETP